MLVGIGFERIMRYHEHFKASSKTGRKPKRDCDYLTQNITMHEAKYSMPVTDVSHMSANIEEYSNNAIIDKDINQNDMLASSIPSICKPRKSSSSSTVCSWWMKKMTF